MKSILPFSWLRSIRVRQDETLGPVFERVVGEAWEPHLEKMRPANFIGKGETTADRLLATVD